MNECRIPNSGTRTRGDVMRYAKLLEKVDREATKPTNFHGRFVQPGSLIPESDLYADGVTTPILLEMCQVRDEDVSRTGSVRTSAGRRRWDNRYILWRWDSKEKSWKQLASATGYDGAWIQQLSEIARMALYRTGWEIAEPVQVVLDRGLAILENYVRELEPSHRFAMIEAWYNYLPSMACKCLQEPGAMCFQDVVEGEKQMEILKRPPRRAEFAGFDEQSKKKRG